MGLITCTWRSTRTRISETMGCGTSGKLKGQRWCGTSAVPPTFTPGFTCASRPEQLTRLIPPPSPNLHAPGPDSASPSIAPTGGVHCRVCSHHGCLNCSCEPALKRKPLRFSVREAKNLLGFSHKKHQHQPHMAVPGVLCNLAETADNLQ